MSHAGTPGELDSRTGEQNTVGSGKTQTDEKPVCRQLLDKLNQSQRDAVSASFDRHALVLAGAGCGKTAVLTRRIAYCAVTFCPQQSILALTFTRKAAEEMKLRLKTLPGIDSRIPEPPISTFHGFCLHLLRSLYNGRPLYGRLGYDKFPRLADERERLTLLARCCSSAQRRFLRNDLRGIDDLVSQFTVSEEKLNFLDAEAKSILDGIVERYGRQKRKENVWEFSDMIRLVLKACQSIDGYTTHVQSQFKAVLVDEFQDTNPLQIKLLRYILGDTTKLFAVGDDDQAIYGFRGADPRPILSFERFFDGARLIRLETNYRNRPAILKVANGIFSDKPQAVRKHLKSGIFVESTQQGVKPVKKIVTDQNRMVEWIYRRMQKLFSEGYGVTDITILCRLNETCRWIENKMSVLCDGPKQPRVMTVHAAKGLEFPVVFVCDLEEGTFPSCERKKKEERSLLNILRKMGRFNSKDTEDTLREERRLFYVAITRAQHQLFCLSVRHRISSGRSIKTIPSRFLKYVR
ncbi:MAG: ATP-dependent helicase [Chitinispirillaceae bacterium]